MDIVWHGYSCFTIKTRQATAVINPYKPELGLKLPAMKADMVIFTENNEDFTNTDAVQGDAKVIDWPGEYEIKELAVMARKSPEGPGTFLTLIAENMKICYMENIGKDINNELMESIGDVDILIIGIGGDTTMDATTAHKIIEEVEPRCVIPMNYAVPGAKKELAAIEPFLKLVGATASEAKDKFSVAGKTSFKEEVMDVVVLKPQL